MLALLHTSITNNHDSGFVSLTMMRANTRHYGAYGHGKRMDMPANITVGNIKANCVILVC